MKLKLFFFTLLFVPATLFAVDKNELLSNFQEYKEDYYNLQDQCYPTIRKKSITAGIDLQNCIWDKDQLLLYKYNFDNILYESSYQRYSRLFNLFKSFALEQSNDFEGLARQEVYFINDSFKLQKNILLQTYGY
ncbi:hypothetical protein N9E52_01805 [Alphaproteobacteria bacterium]|nr:hypothetical protein [Alphaproteobacteria bacterium]